LPCAIEVTIDTVVKHVQNYIAAITIREHEVLE
jgi:hypothetical protein